MTWTIDPAHSSVTFGVAHLGINTVRGCFRSFRGTVAMDAAGVVAAVDGTIDSASVDTTVAERDAHLREAMFLDATRYPTMTFRSRAATPIEGGVRLDGDFTMHGVTCPLALDVRVTAPVLDPEVGRRRLGAHAEGTLARGAWGIGANKALAAGRMMLGETVTFELDLELLEGGATEAAAPVAAAASGADVPAAAPS